MNEPEHELNALTKKLFAEGYTRESYPEWVRPYSWFHGGFEYIGEHQNKMVFSTPCGLQAKGSHWNSGYMSYMGVTWSLENGNPTINCPYRKIGCELNHPLLQRQGIGGGTAMIVPCSCHEIDEEYDYERSVDKAYDIKEQRQEELYKEFVKKKKGRVCREMCHFSETTDSWRQFYDPINICAKRGCRYCSILGRTLDTKKGNVFYDFITRKEVEEGAGLLYRKYIQTYANKGKRLFEKMVSLDICKIVAKTQLKKIYDKEASRHFTELHFAKYHNRFFEFDIENVRAEYRESRDLMQDLADIQEGIAVTHASDAIIKAKQQKRSRKELTEASRKRKYLQLLSENKLEDISGQYKYRILKALDKGIISDEEIEAARKTTEIPEQISLF